MTETDIDADIPADNGRHGTSKNNGSPPLESRTASSNVKVSIYLLIDRMLQYISVFLITLSGFLSIGVCIYFMYHWRACWFLWLLYIPWIVLDRNTAWEGGSTSRYQWFRDGIWWKYYRDYFNVKLHKTADLDPSKKYLMVYAPHGIYCLGATVSVQTPYCGFKELFPGINIRTGTLDTNFHVPFWREWQFAFKLVSVSAKSLTHILRKSEPGSSCMIVVGGAEEAKYAYPGENRLVLKNRKGFVKLAIKTGASLVPVFCFGESDTYYQLRGPLVSRYHAWFKKHFGWVHILFWGHLPFITMPRKVQLAVVVGAPVAVDIQDNPCDEYVDHVWDEYVRALYKAYDAYKDVYAPGVPLEIVA
ncbi:hypothetical protein SeMB42_g05946 [Synchytrium endobioticum]|uniref:Diacylglycerol O-acyltransferase n=1 Tax=Synchytrium endobioticum TaxID=286115 RepID=A0A507DA64_9FUNG|nr:hypothetical protein SeMB42_g05946 [Synchytrium endobioticum]TPX47698.1 hypothetical protein SeLEV6574_g02504 [Synchytrium endobioticum]